MLRIEVLGPPVVSLDGRPVGFDTRKATALLALLAVEARPQPRDRLAALLWPDADALRARSALRRTLSVAAAAAGGAVTADRSLIGLDTSDVTTDIGEFRQLLGSDDLQCLRRAVDLVRDEFLAGFTLRGAAGFGDWQDLVAGNVRRDLGRALSRLVDAQITAGMLDSALNDARRWLDLDPLHEPAHQALIRLYAWTDQRAAALRQYRHCVRVLDEELGVSPLEETTALYDAVRRDDLPLAIRPAPTPLTGTLPGPPPPDGSRTQPAGTPRAGTSPPGLAGREAELAALEPVWAPTARRHIVGISGPAGIGKTALLRAAIAAHGVRLTTVVWRCHPEEQSLALCGAGELLRGLASVVPDLMSRLRPGTRAEIGRLVPDLEPLEHPAGAGLDDGGARARLFAAVRDAVATLDSGAVFVVDDAHWLDRSSADLLAYLMRRAEPGGLRLLLAWSPEVGLPEPLATALADAGELDDATELRLSPLDSQAVTHLLTAAGIDPAGAPRLLADTGGLPGLIVGYLTALRDGTAADAGTPQLVRATLTARLARLSEQAQQVIAAAAVLGGTVDPEVLRDTSGRGDAETVASIEEAQRNGVLVESAGGEGYDFPYDALRRVVLEQLTLARRRLLHGRAADALATRVGIQGPTPAAAGAVARHFSAAGRAVEAVGWHVRAARAAGEVGAHPEALAELEAALALGSGDAEIRMLQGEVLIRMGRYREARMALEQAAASAGDPAGSARVERLLADLHHRLGDLPAADWHLSEAIDRLAAAPRPSGELATALAERSLVAYRRGAAGDAERFATEAVEAARTSGDRSALARGLDVLGLLHAAAGDHAAAEQVLAQSLAAARAAGDQDVAVAALNNLARTLLVSGDVDTALDLSRQALESGARYGDRHRLAALHTNLADVLRACGRDEESLMHLKAAAELFAEMDDEPERNPQIWTLVEW